MDRNRRRLALVMATAVGTLAFLGYALGLVLHAPILAAGLAIVVAVLACYVAWSFGDRVVLRAAEATAVGPEDEPRLHNLVEGVALAARMPKPALHVSSQRALNSLATGRSPGSSSIVVTRGLLETMNRLELEAVVAHELAHIRGRDAPLGTFVATLGLLLAPVPPLLRAIVNAAIPGDREPVADAEGALITRYPPALASALRKVAEDGTPMEKGATAIGHLWLDSPRRPGRQGQDRPERVNGAGPSLSERIRILEEM